MRAVNVDGTRAAARVGRARRAGRPRVERRRDRPRALSRSSRRREAGVPGRRGSCFLTRARSTRPSSSRSRPRGEGSTLSSPIPGFLLGPGDVHRVSTWPVSSYLAGKLRFTTTRRALVRRRARRRARARRSRRARPSRRADDSRSRGRQPELGRLLRTRRGSVSGVRRRTVSSLPRSRLPRRARSRARQAGRGPRGFALVVLHGCQG